MQTHVLLTDYAPQLFVTPEQAAGLVSAACAAGGLLLQYLSYRRGKKEQ